jgi:exonuclease SbcD
MRFVHAADTHIGCSQQGLPERDEDFREAFQEIIDRTLELSPQAFVHAGDLFHRPRPSNRDMVFVAKGLLRLIKEGIEVLLVPGNHDRRPVKGEIAPQGIIELMGARVFGFTEDRRCYAVDGVEFWGLPYMNRKDELLGFISEMGEGAKSPAVLVLHQYLYPPTSLPPCLYPQDIPPVFSYGAFGHWHIPWRGERYAYPGSPEATELSPDQASVRERCFYLVEVDGRGAKVEPQLLVKTRPFFYLDCQEEELVERMEALGEKMDSAGKKPMLRVKLRGGPDMRAESAVENAIHAAGLRRQDFLLVNIIPERAELVPAEPEIGEEHSHLDIVERFFGDDPRLLGLVVAMREAVVRAEADRESSGTQAKRDRQVFIEAAKAAAQEHMNETASLRRRPGEETDIAPG